MQLVEEGGEVVGERCRGVHLCAFFGREGEGIVCIVFSLKAFERGVRTVFFFEGVLWLLGLLVGM